MKKILHGRSTFLQSKKVQKKKTNQWKGLGVTVIMTKKVSVYAKVSIHAFLTPTLQNKFYK